MLFDGGTRHQLARSPVPEADRQLPDVARGRLLPVMIADETATLAGVPDDCGLPRLDRGRDQAGELGQVLGVVDALNGDPMRILG